MNKVTPRERKMAERLTRLQYNSGNRLNEMRVGLDPEEQVLNAYRLGMRFPDWVTFKLGDK